MSLETALQSFSTLPLLKACRSLFKDTLKIPLSPLADSPITPQRFFRDAYKPERHDGMENLFLVGRITDDSFHTATQATADLDTAVAQAAAEDYNGMFLIAADLGSRELTRSDLAARTREINRTFSAPVIVVFKHTTVKQAVLSIGVASRRPHKRDKGKDVLGKVSMIREIHLQNPHRGHLEILKDFSLAELEKNGGKGKRGHRIDSFKTFHAALEQIFNTDLLNKNFYDELSNWFFWAKSHCHFPLYDPKADKYDLFHDSDKAKEHEAKNLIRLLTRTLFVWFIKERGLVPTSLFNPADLQDRVLKSFDPESKDTNYYKAILQNLFFASLNQTRGKREFRKEGKHQNTTTLLRYQDSLKSPSSFVQTLEDSTPFLNGGLFECLDRPHPTKKGSQGGNVIIYEDGFSDRKDNPLRLPDFLFFGAERRVNLSGEDAFGVASKSNVEVRGLIHILDSYKFTIVENTPIDQEIALDPELLGQVFENLLASYNPETKTTARKQTGSFYTPRPIVDYMVDESLKAHLKRVLIDEASMKPEDADAGLDLLFAYNDRDNPFERPETDILIRAIDEVKILDPACGSGAFPMGALHKLVYLLSKLDKENVAWEKIQLSKAQEIEDTEARRKKLAEIVSDFADNNDGYGRKLYLIENCLYGVDIQSIATQVTKLRFFISLVVDQTIDRHRENFGVRPLPNLETKFVTADTLIRVERPQSQGEFSEITKVTELQKELKKVRHSLFSAKTPPTKDKYRQLDKDLREAIAAELKENKWYSPDADKLAAWDPYDQNASASYFDPEWMFGLKAFDIVIGNPPYKTGLTEQEKETWGRLYPEGKKKIFDIYNFFMVRGLQLCKKRAVFSFIVPPTWLNNKNSSALRKLLISNGLTKINYIADQVFQSAVVDSVVFFATPGNLPSAIQCFTTHDYSTEGFSNLSNKIVTADLDKQAFLPSSAAQIEPLADRIFAAGHPKLGEITKIVFGIQTRKSADMPNYLHDKKLNSNCKQAINGKDMGRYFVVPSSLFVEYGSWLWNPRDEAIFKAPEKILIRQVGRFPICAMDDRQLYSLNTIFNAVVTSSDFSTRYVLGVLNSKLVRYLWGRLFPEVKDVFPRVKKEQLVDIPICRPSKSQAHQMEIVIDRIVAEKRQDPAADTSALEREIDQQVYALYGLTPEEIAIVEGGGK